MKFSTKLIHAGQSADPSTGAIMTPIYQTSTFYQETPGKHNGFEYARTGNPTRNALEKNLAGIESGKYGVCFGSGLSAISAVISMLKPGDEVIASSDLYGGTNRLFNQFFAKYNIIFHYTDFEKLEDFKKLINSKTKLVWIETPTNPLMNIIDIKKVSFWLKKYSKINFAVDNTFATPYLQNPLEMGADIVVHSATKYLGGHSDCILGAVICNKKTISEKLYFIQNSIGAVPGPMDCFLVLRGIKTLHVRMKQHSYNCKKIFDFLSKHEKISKVYWPGDKSLKTYKIAKKQMIDFGGMISFVLKTEKIKKINNFFKSLKIFTLAESLGGVESLVCHPSTMTHAALDDDERNKLGIKNNFIRVSVGIQYFEDLIEDLRQSLSKI